MTRHKRDVIAPGLRHLKYAAAVYALNVQFRSKLLYVGTV